MNYKYTDVFLYHPKAQSLLDLGCGRGILSVYAAAKGMAVTAIDKKRHLQDLTEDIPNITFLEKDLGTFIPIGKWDIIIAHHILQFLPKQYVLETFLPALINQMSSDGVLDILTFSKEETLDVPTKFSLEELQNVTVNLGLEVIRAEHYVNQKPQEKLGLHTFHELQMIARKK